MILSQLRRLTRRLVVPVTAVAVFAAAPAAAQPGEPTPLTLRHSITLEDTSVRLADLFDGFGAERNGISGDTVVAYAPQPGRRAIFDAKWLSRVARYYRLDWRPTTRLDRVVVERASSIVDAESITAALRDEFIARGGEQNIELELSNKNLIVHIDASLPPTVEVTHLSTEGRRGKFTAIVAVPAGDPQARRLTVVGQVHAIVEVPVPAQPLRPGTTITERDIKWKAVRAAYVRSDIVTDPAEFVGREAKRPLSAEGMVRRSDLRDPETVSKGMLVTMVFRSSAMLLTASGRALEGGSLGDFITVRNTQTKAVVDAKITGPNRVEVATLRQLASSEGNVQ